MSYLTKEAERINAPKSKAHVQQELINSLKLENANLKKALAAMQKDFDRKAGRYRQCANREWSGECDDPKLFEVDA